MLLYNKKYTIHKNDQGYFIDYFANLAFVTIRKILQIYNGTYPNNTVFYFKKQKDLKEFYNIYSKLIDEHHNIKKVTIGNITVPIGYDEGYFLMTDIFKDYFFNSLPDIREAITNLVSKNNGEFKLSWRFPSFNNLDDLYTFIEEFNSKFIVYYSFFIFKEDKIINIFKNEWAIHDLYLFCPGFSNLIRHSSKIINNYVIKLRTKYKILEIDDYFLKFSSKKNISLFLNDVSSNLCVSQNTLIFNSIF